MKGRPKSIRKISSIPSVSGFDPYGENVRSSEEEPVFLFYEEYEALRLNDYEKHNQCESAVFMGVSRPTFTRIYMSAREKIAKAFVEGRKIIVEGGKVEFDDKWYVCDNCGAIFSEETEGVVPSVCTICSSTSIRHYKLQDDEEMPTDDDLTELCGCGAEVRGRGMGMHECGKGCGRRNGQPKKFKEQIKNQTK